MASGDCGVADEGNSGVMAMVVVVVMVVTLLVVCGGFGVGDVECSNGG